MLLKEVSKSALFQVHNLFAKAWILANFIEIIS